MEPIRRVSQIRKESKENPGGHNTNLDERICCLQSGAPGIVLVVYSFLIVWLKALITISFKAALCFQPELLITKRRVLLGKSGRERMCSYDFTVFTPRGIGMICERQ
jgi:hypothetical protein